MDKQQYKRRLFSTIDKSIAKLIYLHLYFLLHALWFLFKRPCCVLLLCQN